MFAKEDLLGLKDVVDWPYLLSSLEFQKINIQTRRCCCLIHNGTNPTSFSWVDNYFYCFSCLKSGDAFELVQIIKGFNFIESVKYLSDLFGYRIRKVSNYQKKVKTEEWEIPEYIINRINRQNFAAIQIKEEISKIETARENLTNVLISMRKNEEKYSGLESSIESRLNDLDSDLRILTYYLHHYEKN